MTAARDASPFDSLAPLEPLIDKCVHCGFCLATCPSYLMLGQEMASPRGRIYLMRGGLEGRLALSETAVGHFDTCLGCMACETACPSGVLYAPLIEETRAAIERHHTRATGERLFRWLLFAVLPFPRRLRLLTLPLAVVPLLRRFPRLVAALPRMVRTLVALAPAPSPGGAAALPDRTPAAGTPRLRVGLVSGCVQQVFFSRVNHATARVLAAEGCEVVSPRGQGCCGALSLHAGRDGEARAFARDLMQTFEREAVETVAVSAAGCGSAMKGYGHLFRDDTAWAARARAFAAKVRDVTEVLAGLEPRAPRHPMALRVAYHDACHLAHAQGIRAQPRRLLESIPGISLVPLAEPEICCGSAGIFNLVQPDLASALGRRKAAAVASASPDAVATSNPGCMLQISAQLEADGNPDHARIRVLHVMEILDASIRASGMP